MIIETVGEGAERASKHDMRATIPITKFAPPERIPIAMVRRQAESIAAMPLTASMLNSMLNFVFIVNQQRQIVFASRNCRHLLPAGAPADPIGLRLGEALGCVHCGENAVGCGTTEFCRECGMVKAALASLAGRRDVQECRVTRILQCGSEEALDLLVCGTPFSLDGERYAVLSVADISHEKRRRALERIFFHDVLNVAGGLSALAEMLKDTVSNELRADMQLLRDGLDEVLDCVQAQKELAAAESDELPVNPRRLNPATVLQGVVQLFRKHVLARERRIEISPALTTAEIVCDASLLRRVLDNLVKNALEATPTGQTVTVGCEDTAAGIRFWVHNVEVMSSVVRAQVFQRSFSTKGAGRGLGTYSVRLLAQRYLGASVGFTSEPGCGTRFFLTLPKATQS